MISSPMDDDANRRLLAVAEDRLSGFYEHPFAELAARCGMTEQEVLQRLRVMLERGLIRSIRQTLPGNLLTPGCLVAWQLPDADALTHAYDWLIEHDPFSGHVVIREPHDPTAPGANFRLWTTLRLPAQTDSPVEHCRILARRIGAKQHVVMPVVGMFRLSVGHLRRATLPPGSLDDTVPVMQRPSAPALSEQELLVLSSLRPPLKMEELLPGNAVWQRRAALLDMPLPDYLNHAQHLAQLGVIGRFAVILNHTHPVARHTAGTAEAALLMWAVPAGMEERAGSLCARHICMTHCYYRSGAIPFGSPQIMGMVHGSTRAAVCAHKSAIDSALANAGIRVLSSQMHWTVRATVRPSLQDAEAYRHWLAQFS